MTIRIEPIGADWAAPCLDLAAAVFARASTLHRLAGISESDYRDLIRTGFEHNIAQGLSVMARDAAGAVLGCVIVCDILDQGPVGHDTRLRPMQALLHALEDEYMRIRAPRPGQTALVDMAFVAPGQTGAGLYTRLRQAAHDRARQGGFSHVAGVLSSAATQRVVVKKYGQTVLARQRFADFRLDGAAPFAAITDPPEIWLTEGRL